MIKQNETPSANLVSLEGSLLKVQKTNHDNSYTEKVLFILDSKHAHGSSIRSCYVRTK